MSQFRPADERLREAFQALAHHARGECSEQDQDRIWRAVSGELLPGERRDLVDRIATEPALAEAWRVAHELWEASPGTLASTPQPRRMFQAPSWFAAAAVLIVGVAGGLFFWVNRLPGDAYRDQPGYVVESLVTPDTALAREAFRLRWTPGPAGARYQVRVTTEDLRVLSSATELTAPELVLERSLLTNVPSGARVLWQVDVALPSGEHVSSRTFVVRVQ